MYLIELVVDCFFTVIKSTDVTHWQSNSFAYFPLPDLLMLNLFSKYIQCSRIPVCDITVHTQVALKPRRSMSKTVHLYLNKIPT